MLCVEIIFKAKLRQRGDSDWARQVAVRPGLAGTPDLRRPLRYLKVQPRWHFAGIGMAFMY